MAAGAGAAAAAGPEGAAAAPAGALKESAPGSGPGAAAGAAGAAGAGVGAGVGAGATTAEGSAGKQHPTRGGLLARMRGRGGEGGAPESQQPVPRLTPGWVLPPAEVQCMARVTCCCPQAMQTLCLACCCTQAVHTHSTTHGHTVCNACKYILLVRLNTRRRASEAAEEEEDWAAVIASGKRAQEAAAAAAAAQVVVIARAHSWGGPEGCPLSYMGMGSGAQWTAATLFPQVFTLLRRGFGRRRLQRPRRPRRLGPQGMRLHRRPPPALEPRRPQPLRALHPVPQPLRPRVCVCVRARARGCACVRVCICVCGGSAHAHVCECM